MPPAVIISSAAVLAFIVVLVGVRHFIGKLRARGQAELDKRFPAADVLLRETLAQSYGQESRGVTQARGSGTLALTERELFFLLYVPERPLTIPLTSIQAVSIARKHLGKAGGADLLHVRFSGESGDDSIAWRVPNVGAWKAKLDGLMRESAR